MRDGPDRRRLIRSLLDIRLSRFSFAVLAAVSVLATVVIITDGSGHTAAQLTALAALRQPPVAKAQTVTVAAAASTDATSGAAASGEAGSGNGRCQLVGIRLGILVCGIRVRVGLLRPGLRQRFRQQRHRQQRHRQRHER